MFQLEALGFALPVRPGTPLPQEVIYQLRDPLDLFRELALSSGVSDRSETQSGPVKRALRI
jgi:hypothetical protein